MLKVIVFVGCINKSKFLNLSFSRRNFHYGKNVLMIGITLLLLYDTQCSMSKLLTYNENRMVSLMVMLTRDGLGDSRTPPADHGSRSPLLSPGTVLSRWLYRKDNPFGLDQTLGLVLICTNLSSDNKLCRLSDNNPVDYPKLQDNLQVWSKTKDNLNNSIWSQIRTAFEWTCYEIRIQVIQIFLSFVTSLFATIQKFTISECHRS